MNPLDGLPYLFWCIALALPAWYLLYRRWMGSHLNDAALDKRHIPQADTVSTYVAPTLNCKTIERF